MIMAKYPIEIRNIGTYLILLLEQELLIIMSGMYWVNSDTIFHVSLQFKVQDYDFGNTRIVYGATRRENNLNKLKTKKIA